MTMNEPNPWIIRLPFNLHVFPLGIPIVSFLIGLDASAEEAVVLSEEVTFPTR